MVQWCYKHVLNCLRPALAEPAPRYHTVAFLLFCFKAVIVSPPNANCTVITQLYCHYITAARPPPALPTAPLTRSLGGPSAVLLLLLATSTVPMTSCLCLSCSRSAVLWRIVLDDELLVRR